MPGGLLQLINKGDMDEYITGNPQISLFRSVYRRTTNFTIITTKQSVEVDVGFGKRRKFKLSRDGDLLSKIYVNLTNNNLHYFPSNFGHYIFKYIECLVGGSMVDRIYGHYMEVWSRLTEQNLNRNPYSMTNYMIPNKNIVTDLLNNISDFNKYQQLTCACGVSGTDTEKIILGQIQIPIPFWFCRNTGLALPLIALQYDVVELIIEFQDKKFLPPDLNLEEFNFELYCDYILLDTEERRRFAQITHEYLIEQVQLNEFDLTIGTVNLPLKFYHPVKELIFALNWNELLDTSSDINDSYYQIGTIPSIGVDPKLTFEINGNEIFYTDKHLNFFSRREIWEKHTGIGNIYGEYDNNNISQNCEGFINYADVYNNEQQKIGDSIFVHSFAFKPEEHQPTGTVNFSALGDVSIKLKNLKIKQQYLRVYARNYNILRIMSGMGKVLYVN